jgi:hypothetical protein
MEGPGPREVAVPKSRGFKLLSPDQRRRVLSRLRQRWPPTRARDWWHPHDALNREADTLCLEASWLAHEVSVEEFRRRGALRWSKFWMLGEGSPHWDDPRPSFQGEYEVSAAHINLTLSSETICTPRSLDWMIYTNHNEATYLIGSWPVDAINDLWPAWERHIWTTPFDEHPPDHSDGRFPFWWE